METVAVIVPEFGAMAAIVLAVAVAVAIIIGTRSRIISLPVYNKV